MDRGAWCTTVHEVTELDTTEHACTHMEAHVCVYTLICVFMYIITHRASQVAHWVKNLFANAGDMFSPCQEDPLEEGMATHSSILAWRIPMDRRV